MYEQLSKILITNNPFSTICASISSNNIVNLGDIDSGEHTRKNQTEVLTTKQTSTVTLLTRTALLHIFSFNKSQSLQYQSSWQEGPVSFTETQYVSVRIWFCCNADDEVDCYRRALYKCRIPWNFFFLFSSCSFDRDWLLLEEKKFRSR